MIKGSVIVHDITIERFMYIMNSGAYRKGDIAFTPGQCHFHVKLEDEKIIPSTISNVMIEWKNLEGLSFAVDFLKAIAKE